MRRTLLSIAFTMSLAWPVAAQTIPREPGGSSLDAAAAPLDDATAPPGPGSASAVPAVETPAERDATSVVPLEDEVSAQVPEDAVEEEDDSEGFLEAVQLHGFGTYAVGVTSDNQYTYGTPAGRFSNIDFALRQLAQVTPQLRVAAGQWFHIPPFTDALSVELDFAFVEWKFSDAFSMRIGQAPMSVGLFGEVFDVGTVRPFLSLPHSAHGASGFAIEKYRGIGADLRVASESGWELELIPFAGELPIELRTPFYAFEPAPPAGATGEEGEEEQAVLGGGLSVRVQTPIAGLLFGVGGYAGAIGGFEGPGDVKVVLNANAAYRDHGFHLVAEYFFQKSGDELLSHALYTELAYRFDVGLEVAVRADWVGTQLAETVDVSAAPSLLDHASVGVGVGYWFTGDFAIKLAYHFVNGNRLAYPAELREAVALGELNSQTHYVEAGASFSF